MDQQTQGKIVAVTSVEGAQQGAVARAFSDAGWRVRAVARSARQTAYGASHPAQLETGEGLAAAFQGADAAIVALPQDHRPGVMTRIADAAARAARDAGVARFVLNTGGPIAERSSDPLAIELRAARSAARAAFDGAVILQPTVYMDNLLAPWSVEALRTLGVLAYPAPAEARIAWVSHRTLGEFALAAATHVAAVGREFRIGGPRALRGGDVAAALSVRLGKPIAYQATPLDAFAAGLNAQFGAPAGDRIASIYARLVEEPDALAVGDAAARALGVAPEDIADFARRNAWH
ncbi:MAG: NmrA family NAD(P)-binding protein [Hyphomonadaceae bacterium]|nr:NmrA family NAD(P)-binding protein [Hyphomonadaceae bacterium]